jgi:hypothetical protein
VRITHASNVAHKGGIEVKTAALSNIEIRKAGANHWLSLPQAEVPELHPHKITPEVISTEEQIGAAQLEELPRLHAPKAATL